MRSRSISEVNFMLEKESYLKRVVLFKKFKLFLVINTEITVSKD